MKTRLMPFMQGLTRLSPTTLKWLFLGGGASLFAGLFILITEELHEDQEIEQLDRWLMGSVENLRVDFLTGPAVDFTALGSVTVLTVVTLAALLILTLLKDRIGFIYLALGSIGASAWVVLMKSLFTRKRPTVIPRLIEIDGFSYPSGHSLGASAIYFILMFLSFRYFTKFGHRLVLFVSTLILVLLICLSRVYLGVHYPSDVAAGALLGASWAFLLTVFYSWKRASRKPRVPLPHRQ